MPVYELPVYYGGDLWNLDGYDIGDTGNYDGQSESSDYEDLQDFFRDEWLDSCEFHAPDGYYFLVSEDGEPPFPVSKCTAGTDVEESATPCEIAAGFVGYICFGGGYLFQSGSRLFGAPCCRGPTDCQAHPGPVIDFLGPSCCRSPTESGYLRIWDFQECPRVFGELSAATGVVLGVAVVLFNQRAWTHCRMLLQARDRI